MHLSGLTDQSISYLIEGSNYMTNWGWGYLISNTVFLRLIHGKRGKEIVGTPLSLLINEWLVPGRDNV